MSTFSKNNDKRLSSSEEFGNVLPTTDGFCVLPWISICASVEGLWGRCCMDQAMYGGHQVELSSGVRHVLPADAVGCISESPYASDDQPDKVFTLGEAFNAPALRETRLAMLRGELVPACSACRQREAIGAMSYRINMNNHFSYLDWKSRIEDTQSDGSISQPPVFLDLRLGNKCNLRCIMCDWPTSSSLGQGQSTIIDPYSSDPQFLTEIERLAPNLERVYFAGGEPLLQKGHRSVIEMLLRHGYASSIDLVYNTNLTVLPEWCLEAWPQFRSVDLGISCDGVGDLYERIRLGASWEQLLHNLKRLENLPVQVRISVTPQRANLNGLVDLIRWTVSCGFMVDLTNLLQFPQQMSLIHENPSQLILASTALNEVANESAQLGYVATAHEVRRLVDVLQSIANTSMINQCGLSI